MWCAVVQGRNVPDGGLEHEWTSGRGPCYPHGTRRWAHPRATAMTTAPAPSARFGRSSSTSAGRRAQSARVCPGIGCLGRHGPPGPAAVSGAGSGPRGGHDQGPPLRAGGRRQTVRAMRRQCSMIRRMCPAGRGHSANQCERRRVPRPDPSAHTRAKTRGCGRGRPSSCAKRM